MNDSIFEHTFKLLFGPLNFLILGINEILRLSVIVFIFIIIIILIFFFLFNFIVRLFLLRFHFEKLLMGLVLFFFITKLFDFVCNYFDSWGCGCNNLWMGSIGWWSIFKLSGTFGFILDIALGLAWLLLEKSSIFILFLFVFFFLFFVIIISEAVIVSCSWTFKFPWILKSWGWFFSLAKLSLCCSESRLTWWNIVWHHVLKCVRVPVIGWMHYHMLKPLHPISMRPILVIAIVLVSEHIMTRIAKIIHPTIIFWYHLGHELFYP